MKYLIGLLTLMAMSIGPVRSAYVAHAQSAWPAIMLTPVVTGFTQPTHITHAGDGSGRIFVAQRNGRVYIVRNGQRVATPFLDISSRVGEALLSVAFPPGFGTGPGKKVKRAFYVNYVDGQQNVVIARYHVSSNNPDVANSANEEIVLRISPAGDPSRANGQHSGGELAFGPDGYLYVGVGDGGVGGEGDMFDLAQSPQSLRGKILRLDVEAKKPYRIPSSNPFARQAGWRGEIWALGLRNPFRSTFDRLTGDYYIADVGESRYEEVNMQPGGDRGGQNYGWPIVEGIACFAEENCDQTGLTPPVHAYDYDAQVACSVTGGRVYRGSAHPALQGIYIFGDLCIGKIFGLRRAGDGTWESQILHDPETGDLPSFADWGLVTFGDDEAGNVYAGHYWSGQIYQIVSP